MGKIYQVLVCGFKGEKKTIDLCNTEEQMKSMTVKQLRERIAEKIPETAGLPVVYIFCFWKIDYGGMKVFCWFLILCLYRRGSHSADLHRQDAGAWFWPALQIRNPTHVHHPHGDQTSWRSPLLMNANSRGDQLPILLLQNQPIVGFFFFLQWCCNFPVKNKINLILSRLVCWAFNTHKIALFWAMIGQR